MDPAVITQRAKWRERVQLLQTLGEWIQHSHVLQASCVSFVLVLYREVEEHHEAEKDY